MEQPSNDLRESFLKRPIQFLFRWRPFPLYELISYLLMFAATPMLFYRIQPYDWQIIKIILLSIGTLYAGFFAALIWNDITDADIDSIVHPSRPLPQGNISPRRFFAVALVFSFLTFLFALLTSPWCFLLVGFNALFVTFHNKYLKKKITLPAYSEIFTPVQWLVVPLFGAVALWTALPPTGTINFTVSFLGPLSIITMQLLPLLLLVLFTYFADDAHDLAEGIHDAEGDRKMGVRTYATSFGESVASKVSFAMVLLSGVIGIFLYVFTILSIVFLLLFLVLWLSTLYSTYTLVRSTDEKKKEIGKRIGRKGYNFLLFTYVLIFVDVLIQLLTFSYFGWVLP